jgi:hypothetical protein
MILIQKWNKYRNIELHNQEKRWGMDLTGKRTLEEGILMIDERSQRSETGERRLEVKSRKLKGRDQRIEYRRQRSDDRSQGMNLSVGSTFGIWVLVFGFSLSGCVSEPSRTYKKEFMHTYAELTLLYERQKMEKKESDSAYQVTVQKFFEQKGLKQEDFKKAAEELSQNPQVWKLFIGDVATAVDSMKNIK